MAQYRLVTSIVFPVMHQLITRAHTPKRSCPHLVFRGLVKRTVRQSGLSDSITGSDVVDQEITVWMDDFVSKGSRYDKGPAVDDSSRGGCGDRWDVANVTTDLMEQRSARL